MPWYEGSCRITIVGVAASWPQRVVVSIRRGATIEIPGVVGTSQVIDAGAASHGWDLSVEHQYEGTWRPNIRAIQGKWADSEHGRSQLIRSKDHDWPGDTSERNLVIRIDRIGSGGPAPEIVAGARKSATEALSTPVRQQSAARRSVTESASAPERQQSTVRRSVTESASAPERQQSTVRRSVTESTPATERQQSDVRRPVTESASAPAQTRDAGPRVATQGQAAPAVPRVTSGGGSSAAGTGS